MSTLATPTDSVLDKVAPSTMPPSMRRPVVVAVDAHSSAATLETAKVMAARLAAPLHAIAVLEQVSMLTGIDGVESIPPTGDGYQQTRFREAVYARLEKAWDGILEWQLITRVGNPARVIVDEARRRNAALIVMGKGRHALQDRLPGGEITLRVATIGAVPLLAVAPDTQRPARKIVVGVDFSVSSFVAARAALALIVDGSQTGSKLTLVHIRPVAPIGISNWSDIYGEAFAPRMACFIRMLEPFAPPSVSIESCIIEGSATNALLQIVEDTKSDVIAVGTSGPVWWERVFFGSTATNILRRASTTVLIAPVPPPQERIELELALAGRNITSQPSDWTILLDLFSLRNGGRPVRLEVIDAKAGATAVLLEAYRFSHATFDSSLRRATLEMNGEERRHSLTHTMSDIARVSIATDSNGRDHTLMIEGRRVHSVLTFLD